LESSISKSLISQTSNSLVTSGATETLSSVPQFLPKLEIAYDALSPDSLFKLLKALEWKGAVSRMAQCEDESNQWVKNYDEKNSKMLWRRLPIHEACIRQPTAEVIAALLDVYPFGAKAKDNQGRTPLHYAVIHGAHIDVIHLLLHANYDAIQAQDFFFKIPEDYAYNTTFTHKAEVIAALNRKNKQDISASAAGVKKVIRRASSGAGMNAEGKEDEMSAALAEELNQALAEVDAAYTVRDVALANGEVFRMLIRELRAEIIGHEIQMEAMNETRKINENCMFLLEEKHDHVVTAVDVKYREIQNLQKQAEKYKELRHADAVMREKLKSAVSSLTEQCNGNIELVEYWKLEAEKLEASKNESEEKRESLEELVRVYQDRSRDFEEKFNSVKGYIANAEGAALQASSMAEDVASSKLYTQALSEIKSLCTESSEKSDIMYASEAARMSFEKQITVLEEDLAQSRQEAVALGAVVKTYHVKVSHMEDCIGRLTGHLFERTEMLSATDSTVQIVEDKLGLKIQTLEDLVSEYDEHHRMLEEMTAADGEEDLEALFKSRDAETTILSLQELVSGYEEDNDKLNLNYTSCKIEHESKLQSCKSEFEEKISCLEDVVKMYRDKTSAMEKNQMQVFESTSKLAQMEEQLVSSEKEKEMLRNELVIQSKKQDILSDSVRTLETLVKDFHKKATDNIRPRATEHLTISQLAKPERARTRYKNFDESDDVSVCSGGSTRSTNTLSTISSSTSRRSRSLNLRTQHVLRNRLPSPRPLAIPRK